MATKKKKQKKAPVPESTARRSKEWDRVEKRLGRRIGPETLTKSRTGKKGKARGQDKAGGQGSAYVPHITHERQAIRSLNITEVCPIHRYNPRASTLKIGKTSYDCYQCYTAARAGF